MNIIKNIRAFLKWFLDLPVHKETSQKQSSHDKTRFERSDALRPHVQIELTARNI